jgi:hypothetical protein
MRTIRFLVAAGLVAAQLAAPPAASGAEYSAPAVGLASAYAINSQTTGWTEMSIVRCDVGAESLQSGDVAYARCTLEFDLGGLVLPPGAVITGATLNLYTPVNGNCAGNACSMSVSGYAGNAANDLADFTAGSLLGSQPMGLGATASYSVTEFVKSIQAGPSYPVAGFVLARAPSNPADDRLTVGHTASAHPPQLIVTYAAPVQLTVATVGSGSVTGDVSPISCPNTCTGQVAPGTTVTLQATPASGYSFSQWVGSGCAGQGDRCTFAMPGTAVTMTAVFLTIDPAASPTPKATGGSGSTAGPGATDATTSAAPDTAAPTSEVGAASSGPAPTIVGLGSDPVAGDSPGSGLLGILAVVAVVVVLAGGIGFVVYRVAAARSATR